jgi:hypothetical protein
MILFRMPTPVGRIPGIKPTEPAVPAKPIDDRRALRSTNQSRAILEADSDGSLEEFVLAQVKATLESKKARIVECDGTIQRERNELANTSASSSSKVRTLRERRRVRRSKG